MNAALKTPYDVIFMDMQMPVMDGVEATRIIKAQLGDVIQIIGLTANAMKTEHQLCLNAGMSHVLTKPLVLDELAATLKLISAEKIAVKLQQPDMTGC
ncbi:response regulator [Vibrio sp. PP-XX7]